MICFELPWPPSVNHYYRHVGHKTLISRAGRAYREIVCSIVADRGAPMQKGKLSVTVDCFPPDNRKRDLDNLSKALLDALEHAGAIENDSQVHELTLRKHYAVPHGNCFVEIGTLP